MRLLLDTHAFIWHREGNPLLSKTALAAIGDYRNQVYISIATIWEMSIKTGNGKLKLKRPLAEWLPLYTDAGAEILPVTSAHALAVETLPQYHRDPFDRMLITQALQDEMTLVTRDGVFYQYGVSRLW